MLNLCCVKSTTTESNVSSVSIFSIYKMLIIETKERKIEVFRPRYIEQPLISLVDTHNERRNLWLFHFIVSIETDTKIERERVKKREGRTWGRELNIKQLRSYITNHKIGSLVLSLPFWQRFFLFSLSYSGRKFIAINANSIEYRDAENPWKLFRFVNEIEIGEMVGTGELDTRVHTSVC